tara:strand:- start:87 stop:266 length:180 start_codon:yes stop_codon:yes gene_type:complete
VEKETMPPQLKKGKKWDGRSRISNEQYRKNYDEIFKKKKEEEEQDQHGWSADVEFDQGR